MKKRGSRAQEGQGTTKHQKFFSIDCRYCFVKKIFKFIGRMSVQFRAFPQRSVLEAGSVLLKRALPASVS